MSPIETARLIAEILGILVVVGGGMVWALKLLYRVLAEGREQREMLTGVHNRLDTLNGSVARHESELSKQREINAHLKGTLGLPLEKEGIGHEPQSSV